MKSVISNNVISNKTSVVKGILLGTVVGVLGIVVLLLITGIVLTQSGNIPTDFLNIVMLCIGAIGVFISSYIALRIIRSGGLLWGCANGLFMFIIIFTAGLISSTDTLSSFTFLKLAVFVLCGGLGGIISVNKRNKLKIK